MVPGSTLTYGSSFWRTTFSPRDVKRRPREAVVMPLPRPEATPPVTNTYLVCSFTTEPDCSRRPRLRCEGRRPRRAARPSVASSSLGPDPIGLAEELFSVRQGVLGGFHAGQHPRELGDAVGAVEHARFGGAFALAHTDMQVGEAGDLREVGHDEHLMGRREPC